MRRSAVLFLFLLVSFPLLSQSLDFLGLPSVSFGMKLKDLTRHQLIMDTSSSYSDTALYLRNTRCQMYYQKEQQLQLNGFTASHIEYEFCDSALEYLFVYVSGRQQIDSALQSLHKTFHFRHPNSTGASVIDTHTGNLRMIIRVNWAKNEMNFVLIPRTITRKEGFAIAGLATITGTFLFLVLNNNLLHLL